MNKPLKVFVVGVLLSAVILGVGYLIQQHQLNEVESLIAECQNNKPDPNAPKGPWSKWQKDPSLP
ncbi:hypothetical protein [Pseudomonas qingdaonensis]|uniref:hypothetical protein n=1 Tax=Pseudomonas qingdaonensis TaxID=2056231 RepID=UPI0033423CD2